MAKSPNSFPYTLIPEQNAALPLLTIELSGPAGKITGQALLDSGASVSVLPRSIGERLGLDWNAQTRVTTLGGAVMAMTAKIVILETTVQGFPAVPIGYAWAENDSPRLILGQVNFFQIFKICFNRKAMTFDLRRL